MGRTRAHAVVEKCNFADSRCHAHAPTTPSSVRTGGGMTKALTTALVLVVIYTICIIRHMCMYWTQHQQPHKVGDLNISTNIARAHIHTHTHIAHAESIKYNCANTTGICERVPFFASRVCVCITANATHTRTHTHTPSIITFLQCWHNRGGRFNIIASVRFGRTGAATSLRSQLCVQPPAARFRLDARPPVAGACHGLNGKAQLCGRQRGT